MAQLRDEEDQGHREYRGWGGKHGRVGGRGGGRVQCYETKVDMRESRENSCEEEDKWYDDGKQTVRKRECEENIGK